MFTIKGVDFDIDILYDHIYIDAKSFLGVLGLGLRRNLTVQYFGENAKFETKMREKNTCNLCQQDLY